MPCYRALLSAFCRSAGATLIFIFRNCYSPALLCPTKLLAAKKKRAVGAVAVSPALQRWVRRAKAHAESRGNPRPSNDFARRMKKTNRERLPELSHLYSRPCKARRFSRPNKKASLPGSDEKDHGRDACFCFPQPLLGVGREQLSALESRRDLKGDLGQV
jgi:hypothetical protein